MQGAEHDVGRLSRGIGGSAGAAVAVLGLLTMLDVLGAVHLPGLDSSTARAPAATTAAALTSAGVALLLLATSGRGAPRRVAGYAMAGLAATTSLAAVSASPATAFAILLAGCALALLDVRLPGGRVPIRVADPLAAVTAIIAVVAPLPQILGEVPDPVAVMSPAVGVALLALAGGTVLARPGLGAPVPVPPALAEPLPVPEQLPVPEPPLVPEPLFEPALAESMLQSMNEAVMVLDANHRVIDVNRRWRELTGHQAEDAVGLQPPYPWAPDASGGDQTLHRVDGTHVPVLATMAAVADGDGRTRAYVATYVDIGEHKRAEEALSTRAEALEAVNAQLRDANSRLESALQFKNDLTSMLTHDVAQPITSMAILSEMLISDWADLPDHDRLDLATKIDKNTTRVIRMMKDLQSLFRLDTGAVTAQRTPVPICELVENVADDLGAEDVEIIVDEDMTALADRAHLENIVRSLLDNAVRYGSAPIEVRAVRAGDRVQIVVQDQGDGIPAELLPNLFDRFMRGAGLGLFIVRHLVEANGGSVHYERAEPHGARLIIDLEPGTPTPTPLN